MKRHPPLVAAHKVPGVGHTRHLDLQPLHRRVDITCSESAGRLFPQHVPRFDRPAQLQSDTVVVDLTDPREAELEVRHKPSVVERKAVSLTVGDHILKVLPDEVGQHEPVVECGPPVDQRRLVRCLPEPHHERAQQELLRQAHARVGRHLEAAELHQPLATRGRVGRVELVDAELGTVRVARAIH